MILYLSEVDEKTRVKVMEEYRKIKEPIFSEEDLENSLAILLANEMHVKDTSNLVGEVYVNEQLVMTYGFSKKVGKTTEEFIDLNQDELIEKIFVPNIIDYCYCSKTEHPWNVVLK